MENRRKTEEKQKKGRRKRQAKTDKREAESKMGRDEELRRERCSNFMNYAKFITKNAEK